MDLGLRNKAVLITGGERGIGRAIALGMAEEGCRVAIADHRLEKGPDSTLGHAVPARSLIEKGVKN